MALNKGFTTVVCENEGSRREISELTVLDKSDKNTIYNLVFAERAAEDEDK